MMKAKNSENGVSEMPMSEVLVAPMRLTASM